MKNQPSPPDMLELTEQINYAYILQITYAT